MKALCADIILKNTQKTFTPEDCRALAAWAFKTTVLANHIGADVEEEPFFTTTERYTFARELTIPSGVHVWIARRNAGFLTAAYRSLKRVQQPHGPLMPHLVRPPDSPYQFETYTCTFSIGFLLLQILAVHWANPVIRKALDCPTIIQGAAFNDYATPVWPNKRFQVNWPPLRAIDNTLFETFWDRFEEMTLPPWMGASVDGV